MRTPFTFPLLYRCIFITFLLRYHQDTHLWLFTLLNLSAHVLSKLNSRQKSLERLRVGNWTLSLRGKGGWDRDMVVRLSFRDREIQFQGGGNGSTFQALHFLGDLLLWVLGGTARIKGHTIPGVIRVPSEDECVQKFYQTTFSSSQSVGHSVKGMRLHVNYKTLKLVSQGVMIGCYHKIKFNFL